VEDIYSFLEEIEKRKVSFATRDLFRKLATYNPDLRLALNLSSFLGQSLSCDISNVLSEGLNPAERMALIELDSADLPVSFREISHGLLNVFERWRLHKSITKYFRTAKELKANYIIEPGLLSGILGQEK
jgi:hypothetical protein